MQPQQGMAGGGRFPSLDGLRAVSIGFVIATHLMQGWPGGAGRWAKVLLGHSGDLGVAVFFTISGFLITSLLVAEDSRAGRIDLRAFYIRRSLRIFPAFYVYTRLDALMVGCLAATLAGGPRFERALALAFAWRIPLLAIPFLLVGSPMLSARFGGAYRLTVGYSLEAVAITLTVLWLVRRPGTIAGRVLNWRPVAYVGTISYGLYLWQQPFTEGGFGWWAIPISLAAAEMSSRLVERPALRLRDNWFPTTRAAINRTRDG